MDKATHETIAGYWVGGYEIGPRRVFLEAHFTLEAGTVQGTVSMKFEGTINLEVTRLELKTSRVHFELLTEGGRLSFRGQCTNDTILGAISHAATQGPFQLVKVAELNPEIYLAGTLKIPLTQGPHPALILLHGSGPQLRDHADLQFMADFFALNGIAVLAYDKRGTGASTRDAGETTLLDKAEDVLAGLALLQQRDDINSHQIGLWGLSQGGWIAPTVAARSQDVAFIILVSGPAVGVVQQDLDRIEYELRASEFSAGEIDAALAHQRLFSEAAATGQGWEKLAASIQKARNTRWASYVSLPSQEDFEQSGRRWGRFRAYDPLPYLERTTCPVLAIFGEKDTVVPPEKNVSLMAGALKRSGNTDYTIEVFPEASHTMLYTKTGASQEIPYRTHFVPGYFETMRDWLLARVE